MVGVATRHQCVQSEGYGGLLGDTDSSWGWDLGRKKAVHCGRDSQHQSLYPATLTHHHQWTVPDTFYMVLDMDHGTLAWVAGY